MMLAATTTTAITAATVMQWWSCDSDLFGACLNCPGIVLAVYRARLNIHSELHKHWCAVLGLKLEKRSVLACPVSAPQEAAGRQAKKLAVSGR